jgi:hypothetical protein
MSCRSLVAGVAEETARRRTEGTRRAARMAWRGQAALQLRVGVVLTGSAVVGTLADFYAVDWDRDKGVRLEPVVAEAKAPATPAALRPARVVPPLPAKPPPRSTFAFTAARGDSWFQARMRSFSGRVLYDGTLSRGETVRIRARRLWIRFGAAAHLDLTINGRPVRLPAFGTFDAFAGPRGLVADRTDYATAAQSP